MADEEDPVDISRTKRKVDQLLDKSVEGFAIREPEDTAIFLICQWLILMH